MITVDTNAPIVSDAMLECTRFPLKSIWSNKESKFCHVPFQEATKMIVTRNWQNAKSYAKRE